MTHPAAAPTLPCPAMWPAMPPTMAPLMQPFASAAAGANIRTRMAVVIINGFMINGFMALLQMTSCWNKQGDCDWFQQDRILRRAKRLHVGRGLDVEADRRFRIC